jgi:hypothetical protein
MKIIKLTEDDIKSIIKESVKRTLKEDYGFNEFGGLSDAEYDELQQNIIDKYEQEDEDYNEMMADEYSQEDNMYNPSDGDLYRGM